MLPGGRLKPRDPFGCADSKSRPRQSLKPSLLVITRTWGLSPVQFGVIWCGSYFGVTYIGCHSESGVIWVVSLTVPAKLTPALLRTECTPESRMQFSSNLPGMNRTLSALDASFAARSSGIERHCLVALSSVLVLANRLPTSQSPSH